MKKYVCINPNHTFIVGFENGEKNVFELYTMKGHRMKTKAELAARNRSYQYKSKCVDCGKAVTMKSLRCRSCGGKHLTKLNDVKRRERAGL